jgi:hypothetical protein
MIAALICLVVAIADGDTLTVLCTGYGTNKNRGDRGLPCFY